MNKRGLGGRVEHRGEFSKWLLAPITARFIAGHPMPLRRKCRGGPHIGLVIDAF
jgi:hypothetical protein